jgi:hypothetical protein
MRKGFKTGLPAWNANPIYRNCLICNKEFRTILAKVKVGKGKFCSKDCYLVDHSKNTWSIGACDSCHQEFKFRTCRKQTCCSLSCNSKWKRIKNNDNKRIIVNCKQCDKETKQFITRVKDNRGKYCSKKCYSLWLSINQCGENSLGWKGGITPLYRTIRTMSKYKHWRETIIQRDNHTCILCGSLEKLEVDHIKSLFEMLQENNITDTTQANNCIILWDIDNGRTLCHGCHKKTDNYGYKSKLLQ